MASFDLETLNEFRDLEEIAIRTDEPPDRAVPVWVAVASDQVFVRSARGTRGRWYRDVVTSGGAMLEFADRRLPDPCGAGDRSCIGRPHASRGYRIKYPASRYLHAVLKPDVLPTTLRLEPL